jgi:hypothetical protein
MKQVKQFDLANKAHREKTKTKLDVIIKSLFVKKIVVFF